MVAQEPDAFFGDLRLPVWQLSALQTPLEYVRGGFVRVVGACLRSWPILFDYLKSEIGHVVAKLANFNEI